jgi:hypothetical protein
LVHLQPFLVAFFFFLSFLAVRLPALSGKLSQEASPFLALPFTSHSTIYVLWLNLLVAGTV